MAPRFVRFAGDGPSPGRALARPALGLLSLCAVFAALTASALFTPAAAEAVCWKDSYGRGVGTVPTRCAPGQERIGLLCYDLCPSGWNSEGPACTQPCRSGYHDDGLTCRRDAHIIGADNRACPWYDVCGLTFAAGCSTCPAGYINDGCTCRRDVHIYGQPRFERAPHVAERCGPGEQLDAGLCYPTCDAGFDPVGPVCWSGCPDHAPVDCGAVCGSTAGVCAEAIANMVLAPVDLVTNVAMAIGTGGTSSAARAAARAAAEGLATEAARQVALAATEELIREGLAEQGRQMSDADITELAATIVGASADGAFDWAALDPTGVMAVVDAFDQPLCGAEPAGRIVCDANGCTDADGQRIVLGNDGDGDGAPDAVDPRPEDPRRCGDLDGDGCDDCIADDPTPMEARLVTVHTEHGGQWAQVDFCRAFAAPPVVVVGPVGMAGDQAATVRVRDVTTTGFRVQVDEWDYLDGGHAAELMSYVAVPAGTHHVDGGRIVARRVRADHAWIDVPLDLRATPLVLPQVTSFNGGAAVNVRLRDIGPRGAALRLQEEEAADGTHAVETVDLLAIEPGVVGFGSLAVETGAVACAHTACAVDFARRHAEPHLLAAVQTYIGADPIALRLLDIDGWGAELFGQEEQSRDAELGHAVEQIGWAVFADRP